MASSVPGHGLLGWEFATNSKAEGWCNICEESAFSLLPSHDKDQRLSYGIKPPHFSSFSKGQAENCSRV